MAQVAGVSPITVSRALRGERAVDPALAKRAQEAALRLGYVPDPAARALASQRSSQVGLLVPMLSNALFVEVLECAQATLRRAGFQALIGVTHYDPQEEEQILRELLLHRPAGLLVTGFDFTERSRQLIASGGTPCVHMMELAPEGSDAYCVGFSQAAAGAAMTRHLLNSGRRRIAFAAAQLDPRTMQRREGWRRELQAAGLHDSTLEWTNPAPSSLLMGAQMLEQILSTRPAVDAIFFCNDDLAQGALLSAARTRVAVPHRVAIAGFNDLTGSDQMPPPLTTVRTPRAEIGRQSALMLLALMRGQAVASHALDLGFELVVRASG